MVNFSRSFVFLLYTEQTFDGLATNFSIGTGTAITSSIGIGTANRPTSVVLEQE